MPLYKYTQKTANRGIQRKNIGKEKNPNFLGGPNHTGQYEVYINP